MTKNIGKPIPGKPDAVKVARPVWKGGWGNTVWLCALPLPYWHCHILEHEDNSMMRPYVLV